MGGILSSLSLIKGDWLLGTFSLERSDAQMLLGWSRRAVAQGSFWALVSYMGSGH